MTPNRTRLRTHLTAASTRGKMKSGRTRMPEETRIPVLDRIKQADAARVLGCSRQRIVQRIKKGSLKFIIIKDAMGNETVYVSLKQVQKLKVSLERETHGSHSVLRA